MTIALVRYWFEFGSEDAGRPSHPWVGVTAWTADDARHLLSEKLFNGEPLPPVVVFMQNVDVSTLDEKHVLPNIAPSNERGIWYPKGFW